MNILEKIKNNQYIFRYLPQKSGGGFTLIEVIISIFLLTAGVLGAFAAIQQVIVFTDITSSRLEAIYLGQEGIEIIRNIRDTNWLEGRVVANPWNEGLTGCLPPVGCIVDYNHSYGPNLLDPVLPIFNNQFLNIDVNGFYSYASGVQTKFRRKIIIEPRTNYLRVSAVVKWQERGRSHEVTTEGRLYKWLR